jgi:tetratricopeptide (TPR) repeat protein
MDIERKEIGPLTHPYKKIGSCIQLQKSDVCAITAETFEELQQDHFNHSPPMPPMFAYVQDKTSSAFYDAAGAVHWLEQKFTNPKNRQACERVSLFIQKHAEEPFKLFFTSYGDTLDPHLKNIALAFSLEKTEEANQCRQATIHRFWNDPTRQQEVAPICEFILAQNPHDILALDRLGAIKYTEDMNNQNPTARKEAIALLERALTIDPKDCFALAQLGVLYASQDRDVPHNIQKARDLFKQALRIDPKNVFVLGRLGELYLFHASDLPANAQSALYLYERALALDPNDLFTLTRLGALYCQGFSGTPENQQNKPEANGVELDLEKLDRSPGSSVQKNPRRAVELFKKALQIQPSTAYALANTVYALSHLGFLLRTGAEGVEKKPVKALEYLEKALSLKPTDPFTIKHLLPLYLDGAAGLPPQEKKAVQILKNALRLAPHNVTFLTWLGIVYLTYTEAGRNNPPEAEKLLKKALEIDLKNVLALVFLGMLYTSGATGVAKNEASARIFLEAALSIDPANARAQKYLDILDRRLKKQNGADDPAKQISDTPEQRVKDELFAISCLA